MEAFRGDHRYFMIGISNNYHQLDQVREGVRKPDERESFLLEQEKRECEIFGRLADLGMRPLVGDGAVMQQVRPYAGKGDSRRHPGGRRGIGLGGFLGAAGPRV